MSEPPPPPQVSPDGKFYWDGERWVPMPAGSAPTPPSAPSAALASLKLERSFGGLLGGCKVKIEKGYLEIKGAAMNARARVPIEMVDLAVMQRSTMGTPVANQPQLVLIGRGAELGHADLPLGRRKAGEEAADWINGILKEHRSI